MVNSRFVFANAPNLTRLSTFGIFTLLLLMVILQVLETRRAFGPTDACGNNPDGSSSGRVHAIDAISFESIQRAKTLAALFEERSSTTSAANMSLAFQDSLGFFHGISDDVWSQRRTIARNRRITANPHDPSAGADSAKTWYQMNWEPNLACLNEEMIGNMGDGHKWVCDPHRIQQQSVARIAHNQPPCLVYSIGSNGAFDFERDAQKYMPSCEIHTFDFSDFSYKIPSDLTIHYHVWGLKPSYESLVYAGAFGGKPWKRSPSGQVFKTIQETIEELGHAGRTIDIFKIDCEGCEWYSYKDWIDPSIDIRQIQVEVHHTPSIVHKFFQAIHDANFAMFHKEPNIQYADGNCVEFSFLRMASSYFG